MHDDLSQDSKEPQERLVIEVPAKAVLCFTIFVKSLLRKIPFELFEKTQVRYSTHNLARGAFSYK